MKEKQIKKRKFKFRYLWFGMFSVVVFMASIYTYFGGFGTGECVDEKEFAAYAKEVKELTIPKEAKVIALGEATHGNREFQELKKEVFEQVVNENGVKAFAIEGDFGGCEKVNAYIRGGSGSAEEAASWIGFDIYRTGQMEQLISYMRAYNDSVSEKEQLRFYGFDMQRPEYSYEIIKDACEKMQVELPSLENLQSELVLLEQVKEQLMEKQASELVLRCVDMLSQDRELKSVPESEGGTIRDQYMAENIEWILKQEQARGNSTIFITGHNTHVGKWESYDSMGKILSEHLEEQYYVIGTDFYKTRCNLPTKGRKGRTVQTFYSHDPFAKAAKVAGMEQCWVDFREVPRDSSFGKELADYTFLGSLGEGYSLIMRLLPQSYRIFQPPSQLYDSMIFVTEANPVEVKGM